MPWIFSMRTTHSEARGCSEVLLPLSYVNVWTCNHVIMSGSFLLAHQFEPRRVRVTHSRVSRCFEVPGPGWMLCKYSNAQTINWDISRRSAAEWSSAILTLCQGLHLRVAQGKAHGLAGRRLFLAWREPILTFATRNWLHHWRKDTQTHTHTFISLYWHPRISTQKRTRGNLEKNVSSSSLFEWKFMFFYLFGSCDDMLYSCDQSIPNLSARNQTLLWGQRMWWTSPCIATLAVSDWAMDSMGQVEMSKVCGSFLKPRSIHFLMGFSMVNYPFGGTSIYGHPYACYSSTIVQPEISVAIAKRPVN